MPYQTLEDLPAVVKKVLTSEAQEYFLEVYLEAFKDYDESTSMQIAWKLVTAKFFKAGEGGNYVIHNHYYGKSESEDDEQEVVGMSEEFKLTSFDMKEPEVKLIMNGDSEEIILEAILATTDRNTEGMFFTEKELNEISEQINVLGSSLPDVNHEKLMSLYTKIGNDPERLRTELKKEKGVFKNIKAAVKDGALWIQGVLDKRYKSVVKNFSGLSIEALTTAEKETGRLKNPHYLGFTLTNNPKLKRAQIAA